MLLDNIGFIYSGPHLIQPLDNLASRFIGPKSSTYFEAELSGSHVKWSLNWAKFFRAFWGRIKRAYCIYLSRKFTGLGKRNLTTVSLFSKKVLKYVCYILKVDEMYKEAPIKKHKFDYVEFTRILKHGKKDDDAWNGPFIP